MLLCMQDVEVEVEGDNKPVKKCSYTRGKSFSLDKDIGTMHYDGRNHFLNVWFG